MPSTVFVELRRRLRGAWPEGPAMRAVSMEVRRARGLTDAERDELLDEAARDVLAADQSLALRDVPADELVARAGDGDRAACAELDRRGVTPPTVPVGPPPVASRRG